MSGVTGRTGAVWERIAVDHAAEAGLPWDRAPLRGTRDTLDTVGSLPGGFLVGYKAIHRGVTFGAKISEAMDQCDRALINVGRPYVKDGNGRLLVDCGGIIPVQIMQRSGYPAGKAYAVTEFDYLIDLALRRQKWRDDE